MSISRGAGLQSCRVAVRRGLITLGLPLLVLTATLPTAACKLEQITIPLGQEVLVVQGVLTLDSAALAQYVVVERSLTGTTQIPDQDSLRGPPRPPLPVSGARVVVTRDDGDSLVYVEVPDTAGVYRVSWTESLSFVRPGRVYALKVTTPDGRVVTGRTRVPDRPMVTGVPPDGATFNRDRDSMVVGWSGAAFTKGIFAQVRPRNIERRLTLLVFTDSATFHIAGTTQVPVSSDNNPAVVWVAGTRETFTVSAMDTAFFNFFRTGNDPFTGAGFSNSLQGGMGVFGSMAPVNRTFDVVGDVDHPFEGRYSLTGTYDGATFSGDLRLFVTRDVVLPVLVSALVDNPAGLLAPRAEASGWVKDGALVLTLLRDPPGQPVQQLRYVINGTFHPNGTTGGTVYGPGQAPGGSFVLTRVP